MSFAGVLLISLLVVSGGDCLQGDRFVGDGGRAEHDADTTYHIVSAELERSSERGPADHPPSHGAPEARLFLLDEPVQLVRPDPLQHRKLVIMRENMQHLHHMHGAVAVVAVVGKFHSGKSFLMNQLMEKQNGFGIGPSVQPKTMGIWMWGKPVEVTKSNGAKLSVIFLDTEGFAASNISESYDAKIFAVSTLLSSYLLYNSVKIIDQGDIDYLELLARGTRLFALKSQMTHFTDIDEFNHDLLRFPPLMWVVQDFHLSQLGSESPKDWLLRLMASSSRDDEYEINLKGMFANITCHTLFLPAVKKELLMDLSRCTEAELTEDYRRERDQLRSELMEGIVPKEKNGRPITGPELASLLEILVAAANDGLMAQIPGRWEAYLEKLKFSAGQDCFTFYENEMNAFLRRHGNDAINATELLVHHHSAANRSVELLKQLLFQLPNATEVAATSLVQAVEEKFEMTHELNSKLIQIKCSDTQRRTELKAEEELNRLEFPLKSADIREVIDQIKQAAIDLYRIRCPGDVACTTYTSESRTWMDGWMMFVTCLWLSMEARDQDQVRQAMWQLLDLQASYPLYIRNKTVKVIVAIARLEWPYSYPHFFQSIYQLIQQDSTTAFGLMFLLTASEELATPREDLLTTSRRQELRTLLLKEMPAMLSILFGILNFHAEKHKQMLRATPPPSPHVSPVKPVGEVLLSGQPAEDFRPVDTLAEEVCSMCLKCLAHIFSWIPLDHLLTLAMLDTLFYFSFYGCHSENDCTDCSGTLGHLAIGCICELLQRSCMPSQLQTFLMHVFEKTFLILKRLTSESAQSAQPVSYASLDDRFLEKCNEYLRVLMSLHLKRVESSPHFPVAEFLCLFQRHTMKQPQMDGYFLCLDAWSDFLDHLTMTHRQVQLGSTPPSSVSQSRCKEPLLNLMDGLLRKVLMNFNLAELSDIDDDRLDDDNETEWQQFVRTTVEVFAKTAELYPLEAFKKLVPLFQSYSATYYRLKQFVVRRANDVHLELSGEDHERLYAVLRDLSTLLQMLGRLAEHFGGTHFLTWLDSAKSLFQGFCSVVRFSNEQELHSILMPLSDEGPGPFEHIFIEVHAHALGALTAFCCDWLVQYYRSSLQPSARTEFRDAASVIQSLCELALPLMSRQIPERISVAAGQMLLTITHAVRPHHLTQIPAVQKFIVLGAKGEFNTLPLVTRQLSYQSVTNIFILPWPEVAESEQHWEGRAHEHNKFITGAVHSFLELRKVQRLDEDQELIKRAHTHITQALAVLTDLVSSVAGESSKSKTVLFTSVKSSVELAASLLPVYAACPDVLSSLMGFLLSVFESLSGHIGKALTQSTMETVMQLLRRHDLQDLLSRGDKLGCDVMEKFLKILINQLSVPGGVGKPVLASMLPFCLESIYPAIAELPVPDVKATFYELLTQILTFNWRYFFPANVLVHMEGEGVDDHLENQEQFVAIMDVYIQSFMQPDMALFKQNLGALQELHRRHKLFSKPQFKEGMMLSFAHILLEVLVQKSHDLIREEVCLCLYTMAAVDFSLFHGETLPSFLSKRSQLREEQRSALATGYKMDEDLPSFVQNIHQFASDLRYFHLLNSALPQGSVKLVT